MPSFNRFTKSIGDTPGGTISDRFVKSITPGGAISDRFTPGKIYVVDRSSDGNVYCECEDIQQAKSIMVARRQQFSSANHKIYTYIGIAAQEDLICRICKTKFRSIERKQAGKCECCCCDHFSIVRITRPNLKRIKKFE